MNKNLLLILLLTNFVSITSYGQYQKSVSVNLGSQGIGLEFKQELVEKLSARGGLSILPIETDKVVQSFSSDTDDRLMASFTNAHVLLDYTIIGNSVRLVAGGAYFFKAEGKITSKAMEGFNIGDRHFTAEEVGMLQIRSDWKGLRPYGGLAFFHDFPQNKVNVSLDLGVYHLGEPKISSSSTGMLYLDETNRQRLEDNLSSYQWLPLIQLSVNYKF